MKIFPFLALTIFLAGCSTKAPNPNIDDELIKDAKSKSLDCAYEMLPELDDGVTSAPIIAAALASMCKDQLIIQTNAILGNESNPYLRQTVKEDALSGRAFVPLVLLFRTKHTLTPKLKNTK